MDLRDLDDRSLIVLPPSLIPGGRGQPRLLGERISLRTRIPDQVGHLCGRRV